MANVFGGEANNGIQRILPTSSDVTQSSQTLLTQPNVYSRPQSAAEGVNLRDFYTKAEINRIIKTKVDTGSVYDKGTIDLLLQALEGQINSSMNELVSETQLSLQLNSFSQSVLGNVQANYYEKSTLYTKSEIDSLISEIPIDLDQFLVKEPVTLLQNTIDASDKDAIPLTLIASSSEDVDVVQQWIDHESNSIGRIRKSGRVEFYGSLFLGQNIESWRPALDVNERRITGVADPVHISDAINKGYMEDFITELIDNIVQGDDKNYIIDALEY